MNLPPGWTTTNLGELAEFVRGVSYDKSVATNKASAGYASIARATNIQAGEIEPTDLVYVPVGYVSDQQYLRRGDILVATSSGSRSVVGKAAQVKADYEGMAFGAFCGVVRGSDTAVQNWLSTALKSSEYRSFVEAVAAGTNINNLKTNDLARFSLALPPLAEQRRILARLDALTARLARARAELERCQVLADRLRNEVAERAFTGNSWPTLTIRDLAEVVTGSTPPTAEKERFFGGQMPFFKPTDLDAGYDVTTPRETLSKDGAARSRLVPADSVLVTCIGATIGKTGFARVECAFNQQINALVPDLQLVRPKWLYWAVTSPQFQKRILDNSSATTLPIINKGRFLDLTLTVPPLQEQDEIVRAMEFASAKQQRIEAEATRAGHLIDRLEQSLLAQAFRGELVPQDANDEPASALLDRLRKHRAVAPVTKRGRRARA